MPNKLTFALGQYAALAIVIGACWGFGSRLLRLAPADARIAAGLAHPMAITLGLGLSICLLQWLGIAGMLRVSAVTAILAAGWLLAVWESLQRRHASAAGLRVSVSVAALKNRWYALTSAERWTFALLVLCLLSTPIAPLAPPLVWDELMYHLPHAQQWAASGRLEVTPWLRYPWFPYNYDLLYAAALLFGYDVLPHLLHATAGWLTAWLIYALGKEHLDSTTACVAAALWVYLTRSEYQAAYVDMGVALFITAACVAFLQWRGTRTRYWLLAWTLALGIAAGAKYQVLGLLPLFAAGLAWHDRRPASWLVALVGLAVPCAYWYTRNAVLAGDPFSPLGGPIFGFTDWNLSDHRSQFEDLRRNRGLPDVMLWAALLAPWAPTVRRSSAGRTAIVATVWMLVVWAASSMYPRYLLSAYPLLVLLSAAGGMHLARTIAAAVPQVRRIPRAVPAVLLVLVALSVTATSVKFWKRVAATPAQRDAILTARVPGYAMWNWLRQQSTERKTFQIGLEDSIYYAPQPIWGEVFGPWRYRDFTELTPAELHARLAAEGFDMLVVHTQRMPQVASRTGFDTFFVLLHADGPVRAYRLATPKAP
ncbi:hypothetical protein BH10PSE18_BH10PSE18_23910 [soil metagenome]